MIRNPRLLTATSLALVLAVAAPVRAADADAAALDTEARRASYALGLQYGRAFVDQDVPELDAAAAALGFADGIQRRPQRLEDSALRETAGYFQRQAQLRVEAYLASNAAREGVTTTESGLQYEVITAGEGEQPEASSVVRVHYTGSLVDGTVFDSSVDRGEPVEFPLDRVIPGWTEGVQLMRPGAKYRFVIPPHLGYGPQGAPGRIPPNSVLIFEVELLGIVAKPA